MTDRLRAAAENLLNKAAPICEDAYGPDMDEAFEQLRAALAEPTGKQDLQVAEQEPVAWQYVWEPGLHFTSSTRETIDRYAAAAEDRLPPEKRGNIRPLYAAPVKREWVSLTDAEVEAAWKACDPKRLLPSFAAAIEAALKEKNA